MREKDFEGSRGGRHSHAGKINAEVTIDGYIVSNIIIRDGE